jgi:transposase InsO family protein
MEPGQGTSFRYSDRLAEAGIAASVGSKGDSYDNAMAEALNGTYKAEVVKLHGPWRSRAELETRDHRTDRPVQRAPPPRRDRRHPTRGT